MKKLSKGGDLNKNDFPKSVAARKNEIFSRKELLLEEGF